MARETAQIIFFTYDTSLQMKSEEFSKEILMVEHTESSEASPWIETQTSSLVVGKNADSVSLLLSNIAYLLEYTSPVLETRMFY